MLSAGRPVFGSVIATRLRHVSVAHVCTRPLSRAGVGARRTRAGAVAARALGLGARAKAATEAAPPTSNERRLGAYVCLAGTCMDCAPFTGVRSLRSLEAGGGDALDEALLEDEEDR